MAPRTTRVGRLQNTSLDKPNAVETLHFYIAGAQTTGAKKAAALVGIAGTIVDVRAHLDTAPTGAAFIVDLNINGVTAFTAQAARPTIAIAGNASTATLPAITAVAASDRLSWDTDQIGSSVAGSDLYLSVSIKRAHVA